MSQDGAQERQDEARYPNLGAGSSPSEAGGHATAREERPCTPLRMDSPEWDSSMDLQTPTPAGTGSGKLEDWIWEAGRLGLRLYIVHATVPSGTVADIYIYIYIYSSEAPSG